MDFTVFTGLRDNDLQAPGTKRPTDARRIT